MKRISKKRKQASSPFSHPWIEKYYSLEEAENERGVKMREVGQLTLTRISGKETANENSQRLTSL